MQLTNQIRSFLCYMYSAYLTQLFWAKLDYECSIGFAVKWSVQMCGSVTVTQQAALNYVMKFCGTQTLLIAGTYGRMHATELRHCLLKLVRRSICTTDSVINTLLYCTYMSIYYISDYVVSSFTRCKSVQLVLFTFRTIHKRLQFSHPI